MRKKIDKRREQMEQEKDGWEQADFLCLTWLWRLVVNEFLMMFLNSRSYLVGLTQLLLLPGEPDESRREEA